MWAFERAIHAFRMEFEPGHPTKELRRKEIKTLPDGSVLAFFVSNGSEYEVRRTHRWFHVRNIQDSFGKVFSIKVAGLQLGE